MHTVETIFFGTLKFQNKTRKKEKSVEKKERFPMIQKMGFSRGRFQTWDTCLS